MINWKKRVWLFFGKTYNSIDKEGAVDSDGKGILQRFNEIIGEDIDENIEPMIANLVDNTLIADTMLERFIGTLENTLGLNMVLLFNNAMRKRVLKIAFHLYKIRGTSLGYEVLFRLLGFGPDFEIVETFPEYSWDSPVTLDDPIRRFDSGGRCAGCSGYEIHLTGSITITPEILRGIQETIRFNEPINARLLGIFYNDVNLFNELLGFEINESGNLIYKNFSMYDADFYIENGKLIVDSDYASNFSIKPDGIISFNNS